MKKYHFTPQKPSKYDAHGRKIHIEETFRRHLDALRPPSYKADPNLPYNIWKPIAIKVEKQTELASETSLSSSDKMNFEFSTHPLPGPVARTFVFYFDHFSL